MTSESHLRNMKIFAENAAGIMDGMSREFEKTYLDTLRRRHGTKRVNANNVYQEVIQDRHHIHMNATKWATLSHFCQYLGRTGKCKVDETERGWYVQYIERDANILARQEAQQRRVEAERAAEERFAQQMEAQRLEASKALDREGGTLRVEATKLERDEDQKEAVSLSFKSTTKRTPENPLAPKPSSVFGEGTDEEDDIVSFQAKEPISSPERRVSNDHKPGRQPLQFKRPRSEHFSSNATHEKLRTHKKQREDWKDYHWVRQGILVRITSKKLGNGRYLNRKAVVEKVLEDKYTAEVEVLDSGPDVEDGGDLLRLDQDDLETVIPRIGKAVRILYGRGRGQRAQLLSTDKGRGEASVELEDGSIVEKVLFSDISKIA